MSTPQFRDLHDFARGFPAAGAEEVRVVVRSAHTVLHQEALEEARALTPTLTGAAKASLRSDPGSPKSAIDAMQPTAIVSDDPKMAALSRGYRWSRRPYNVTRGGKTFRVQRRRTGSPSAKSGIKRPVIARLAARWDELLATAIRSVSS